MNFSGIPSKCESLEEAQTKIFISILRYTQNLSKWNKYFERCSSFLPINLKLLLNKDLTKKQIENIIKDSVANSQSYKSYSSFNKKYQKGLYNFNKDIINVLEDKKSRSKISNIIRNTYKRNNYIDFLIRAYGYSLLGNDYKAKQSIQYLIEIPSEALSIAVDVNLTKKQRVEFEKLFFKLLEKIKVVFKDKEIFDQYLENLITLDSKKLKDIILRYRGDLFYNQIEFNLFNYKQSFQSPTFWNRKLKTSEREVFLQKFFKTPIENNLEIYQYSILENYFPAHEKKRLNLRKKLKQRIKKLDLWETYSVIKSIENPIVKRYFSKDIEQLRKPLFTIKRNMIIKQMTAGRLGKVGALNLISLGFNEAELIWWFYE